LDIDGSSEFCDCRLGVELNCLPISLNLAAEIGNVRTGGRLSALIFDLPKTLKTDIAVGGDVVVEENEIFDI
jgi:hypothetical protein